MSTRRLQNTISPRETILEAATKLFSERGYTGTTMRDIARAVGVLPGSLYAHIDGKETILFDIVEAGIDKYLAMGDEVQATPEPPVVRMRLAIKAHIAIVAENPQRTLLVFHQWRYLSEPRLGIAREKRRRYERVFRDIMEEGMASGDFNPALDGRIAVMTILGALNWTPEWYSPEGKAGPEEIGDKVADTIMAGLLPVAG